MAYQKKTPRPDIHPAILKRLMSPADAAAVLGVAEQTLAHWRARGSGPRFFALSARCVRYRQEDLEAWLAERARASTAERSDA